MSNNFDASTLRLSRGERDLGHTPRDAERALPAQRLDRIHSIDGLRALAFLLVFGFHSWEFAGAPEIPVLSTIVSQNTRPDLFIVLTGFVLFLPFARSPNRIATFAPRTYLTRRLRRIVPPYYAALAVAVALPFVLVLLERLVGRPADWPVLPSVADVATHLTFTHLFFPEYWAGINGSLWTMSLEMQLYLIFPLLLALVAWRGIRVLLLALAVSLVYRIIVALVVDVPDFPEQFLFNVTAIGRLMQFVAGMAAAALAIRWRGTLKSWALLLIAGVVVGGYALATTSPTSEIEMFPVRDTALGLAFAALIVLAVGFPPLERVFAFRPLARLGFMAYSMFLLHQPLVYYAGQFLEVRIGVAPGPVLLALLWTAGFGIVLIAGYVFHVIVEKPCIAWSRAAREREDLPPAGGGSGSHRPAHAPAT